MTVFNCVSMGKSFKFKTANDEYLMYNLKATLTVLTVSHSGNSLLLFRLLIKKKQIVIYFGVYLSRAGFKRKLNYVSRLSIDKERRKRF